MQPNKGKTMKRHKFARSYDIHGSFFSVEIKESPSGVEGILKTLSHQEEIFRVEEDTFEDARSQLLVWLSLYINTMATIETASRKAQNSLDQMLSHVTSRKTNRLRVPPFGQLFGTSMENTVKSWHLYLDKYFDILEDLKVMHGLVKNFRK